MTSIEITVKKGIFRSSGGSSPVVTSQTKKRPGFPPRPIGDGYALPRCVDAVNAVALAGQIICGEAVAAADVQNRGAVGREQPLDVFAEEFVVECGLSIAPAEFAVVCCHGDRGIVRTQFPQR